MQVLCSMDGQATQTQTDSNLSAHFPHKLLLKKSSEKYSKKNKTEPQNECNVRNSIYYKSFLDRNNQ